MSNINNIMDLLQEGIRAETLRQKAISGNVANLETPGYRRVDVNFEEALSKALDSDGNFDPDKLKTELYQPNQTPLKSNGNDVTMEYEVGEMVKNSLRHTTYLRVLNKKFKQIELAMDIK